MEATELFEDAISWLRENYAQFQFFVERDMVWTLQMHLINQVKKQILPYRIFNDFPILPGNRRSLCTDLAIINEYNIVEIAAEFKHEPSHKRDNIWPTKINPSVVFWGNEGVGKDVERVQEFVAKGKAKAAYSVFIDEGSLFGQRLPHPGSNWIHWDTRDNSAHDVSILWSRVPKA